MVICWTQWARFNDVNTRNSQSSRLRLAKKKKKNIWSLIAQPHAGGKPSFVISFFKVFPNFQVVCYNFYGCECTTNMWRNNWNKNSRSRVIQVCWRPNNPNWFGNLLDAQSMSCTHFRSDVCLHFYLNRANLIVHSYSSDPHLLQ